MRWFRSPIEIDIIVDALNNDPDKWEGGLGTFGTLKYPPLGIEIHSACDPVERLLAGLSVTRHGTPIRGCWRNWRIGKAVDRWLRRRDDIALRRLIDDDHTQRVRRITEARAALARDEATHIENLLRR